MDLKKIINILFVTLFTVITIGFTINKHYSSGELFSMAIFSEPESCCADVCACCDEESETIQFHEDYTFSIDNVEFSPTQLELFAAVLSFNTCEPEQNITGNDFVDQDLPPPDNLTRLSYFQSFLL
jgi:hypothetical protein